MKVYSYDMAAEPERLAYMSAATEREMTTHLKTRHATYGTPGERKPIDWRTVAAEVIGIGRDHLQSHLADISHIHHAWLKEVRARFDLSDTQAASYEQALRLAYTIGTLTEDNLPGYVTDITSVISNTKDCHAKDLLRTSLGIWTAEEDAHGRSLNAYGELTGLLMPIEYTIDRMSQLRHGSSATPKNVVHMKAYTAIQEEMAEIAHTNDAYLHDPIGNAVLTAISADEARHGRWFRKEFKQLAGAYPDDALMMLDAVDMDFQMPGQKGIPNYRRKALKIAKANLLNEADYLTALRSVVRQCEVAELTPVTSEAKAAQERLLQKVEPRIPELREVKVGDFALGQTITVEQLRAARHEFARLHHLKTGSAKQ